MTIYLSLQVSGGTQPDPQPLSQLLICLYGFILCVKPAHNSITVRVTKLSPECHKWFSLLMAASRWRQRHYLASLILLWLLLGSHLLLQVELANDGCSWEQLLPGWLQIREGKGAGQSESWAFCEESSSCQSLLGVYLTCLDAWHCGRESLPLQVPAPQPQTCSTQWRDEGLGTYKPLNLNWNGRLRCFALSYWEKKYQLELIANKIQSTLVYQMICNHFYELTASKITSHFFSVFKWRPSSIFLRGLSSKCNFDSQRGCLWPCCLEGRFLLFL